MGVVCRQDEHVIDEHRRVRVNPLQGQHGAVAGQVHRRAWDMGAQVPRKGLHPLDLAFMRTEVWVRSEVSLHQGLKDMAWYACVKWTEGQGIRRRPLPIRLGQVDD